MKRLIPDYYCNYRQNDLRETYMVKSGKKKMPKSKTGQVL